MYVIDRGTQVQLLSHTDSFLRVHIKLFAKSHIAEQAHQLPKFNNTALLLLKDASD